MTELKHWKENVNQELSLKDFQKKAMQKLMKQFLLTPDTKDTVLTRKSILEMIKDLECMGR